MYNDLMTRPRRRSVIAQNSDGGSVARADKGGVSAIGPKRAVPESFYRNAPNWCRDTAFTGMLHPGKRCYREIPAKKDCGCGCSSGDQVCFDQSGTIDHSPDSIAPVSGRTADGYCVIDPVCGPMHMLVDVLGIHNNSQPKVSTIGVRRPVSGDLGRVYGSFSGQMGANASRYESALASPQARAFLDAIAWAEGGEYNIMYGGNRFSSYAQHPLQPRAIQTPYGPTSAAGRYQFERGTWDGAQRALGLPDFSPHSQDLAALYLIDERGQLDKLLSGDVAGVLHGLGCLWAALPYSGCGQGQRSYDDTIRYYNGALAVYGGGGGSSNYLPSAGGSPIAVAAGGIGLGTIVLLAAVAFVLKD